MFTIIAKQSVELVLRKSRVVAEGLKLIPDSKRKLIPWRADNEKSESLNVI